jgi:hypothetical protein
MLTNERAARGWPWWWPMVMGGLCGVVVSVAVGLFLG